MKNVKVAGNDLRNIFGKAGLNVVTNGILWDSLLMEVFIFLIFSLYICFGTL